jgi:uncharacterized protein (DUF1015 family)
MSDPGLDVLPTHRLVTHVGEDGNLDRLRSAIEQTFATRPVERDALEPLAEDDAIEFGYIDAGEQRPLRLTLEDQAIADRALTDKPPPYRRLDTAVLEALVLRDALGLNEDDIALQNGIAYAKTVDEAVGAVEDGSADAAFILRATPIDQVRKVAQAGVPMPPKSTFFFPKVPTGLVFNLLE